MLAVKEGHIGDNVVERIPKKITPDSLLDTFVQIHYTLKVEKGEFTEALHNLMSPEFSLVDIDEETRNSPSFRDDDFLFSGSGILFRVREKLISFNCSEGYIGWIKYKELIRGALQKMYNANWLSDFPRVSVRYINSLPWAPLDQQVKLKFPELPHLPKPEHTLYQTTGYNQTGFQIDVALSDNARLAGADDEPASIFDIGVALTTPTPMENLHEALKALDEAHQIEKEVFFGMLSGEFLATLNPVY